MSYAATTTLVNTVTTDAAFRTWGSAYNAKFTSIGWVNTADTGQINWTTVLASLATNTVQGYEIWRFADTLQSTAPVFLKIEYGAGAAVANGSLWFTLGSGSNGTGSLTGVQSTRQQVQCTATAGAITHYWSGDTNRFTLAVSGATAATSDCFGVERTVDTTGALTSEGCLMVTLGTSVWGQQAWNQVIGPTTASWETTIGSMGAGLAPFGTFGSQVAIYPVFHNKGVFLPPGLNLYLFEKALITAGSPISFTTYGATHTYMPLNTTSFACAGRGGFNGFSAGTMIRYE